MYIAVGKPINSNSMFLKNSWILGYFSDSSRCVSTQTLWLSKLLDTWILFKNLKKSFSSNSTFLKNVGYFSDSSSSLSTQTLWLSKNNWILGYFLEISKSLSVQILCFSKTVRYLDTFQTLQEVSQPQLKLCDCPKHWILGYF